MSGCYVAPGRLSGPPGGTPMTAASDTASVFAIGDDGRLRLLDTFDSGGSTPISATIADRRIYVLNAGSSTVAGFDLLGDHVRPIAGGVHSLSAGAAGPAEVAIAPDGRHLVVTEKASNTLDTFTSSLEPNAAPTFAR